MKTITHIRAGNRILETGLEIATHCATKMQMTVNVVSVANRYIGIFFPRKISAMSKAMLLSSKNANRIFLAGFICTILLE